MTARIMFQRFTEYMGRKVTRKCKGIELFLLAGKGDIVIQPISERDGLGECFISIPKENIDDICKSLQRLKENIELGE